MLNIINRLLQLVLIAAGIAFTAAFLVTAWLHISFPFALEWMEGSMYTHVHRLLSGKPLYVKPSIEFVTAMYTPLYFYVSALLSQCIGFGFAPLRLVSALASLGTGLLILTIVLKETQNRFAAALAAFMYVATYRIGGPYMDMARVDALFLFLFMAGVYFIRFPAGTASYVLAGVFMALTILTKQTGLAILLPVVLYAALFCPRRRAALFALTAAGCSSAAMLVLDIVHNGWFYYYVFVLPRQKLLPDIFWRFWSNEILMAVPAACVLSAVYYAGCLRRRSAGELVFYVLIIGSLVGIACLGRIKEEAYKNVLMTAYAGLTMGMALGANEIQRRAARSRSAVWRAATIGAWALCIVQFYMLAYNPAEWLPAGQYRRACRNVVSLAASIEGRLYAPAYGYLCVMAGKENSAHIGYIKDFLTGRPDPVKKELSNEIRSAIQEKQFSAIALDRPFAEFQEDIERNYRPAPWIRPGSPCWPLIRYLYIPRS